MDNFIPAVWAPVLLEQLKSNRIYRNFDSDTETPKTPAPEYRTVHEGSYLAAVIEDELYGFVPVAEHEEAAQVMIDALNVWISERTDRKAVNG